MLFTPHSPRTHANTYTRSSCDEVMYSHVTGPGFYMYGTLSIEILTKCHNDIKVERTILVENVGEGFLCQVTPNTLEWVILVSSVTSNIHR